MDRLQNAAGKIILGLPRRYPTEILLNTSRWDKLENRRNLNLTRQVEQKLGGRGRGREWATLGVHPLSWLLSNNQLEKVPFVSVPHTSSNWLLLSKQDKGCTPSVAHSLALPLGPTLLNLWITLAYKSLTSPLCNIFLPVSNSHGHKTRSASYGNLVSPTNHSVSAKKGSSHLEVLPRLTFFPPGLKNPCQPLLVFLNGLVGYKCCQPTIVCSAILSAIVF